MSDFKSCPYCGKPSKRDSRGRALKLCGDEECKRQANKDRQAAWRARQKEKAVPAPRKPRAKSASQVTPETPHDFGPVVSPWGERFDCVGDVIADVLMDSGLEGYRWKAEALTEAGWWE